MAKTLTNREETLQILEGASRFGNEVLMASERRDAKETIRLCEEFDVWGKQATARLEAMT